MALLYAGLAWLYPLWGGLQQPRRSWAMLVEANGLMGLGHGLIYVALILLYVIGLRRASKTKGNHAVHIAGVIGIWLAASLAGMASYPGESSDIFDYVFRGRMVGLYSQSPLNTTPFKLQDKPFFNYVSWTKWIDAYGPVWEYVSGGIASATQLGTTHAEINVTANNSCASEKAVCSLLAKYISAYRAFAILCAGLCGLLIYQIVRLHSPERAARALQIWLWNPLLILTTAIGGHNEALVLLPILLSLWALQRKHWLGGLLCLAIAVHIKITCLIVLPPVCLWLALRIGWRAALLRVSAFIALAVPLSWLLYEPLGGWATLSRNFYERSVFSTNSLGSVAYWLLREVGGWERYVAQGTVARYAPLAFVAIAGFWLWRWWRQGDTSDASLWKAIAAVMLIYFLLGSYWFQHWYLLWLVALAVLLPNSGWTLRILPAYVLGSLLAAHTLDFINHQKPAGLLAPLPASVLYMLLLLLPFAVAAWYEKRSSMRYQTNHV